MTSSETQPVPREQFGRPLEAEEQEWRKTILCEAPCYQENRRKRDELEQLIHFATNSSVAFLEANRQNFSDYLQ